jgi:hypothetical protein
MSTRIIQAEARISAVDATGETFAAIAAKVRGVTSAFKSLGNVGASGIGNMNRTISRLQHTMRAVGPVASSAAAYEGMRGVAGLVHETVKATAERAHEQVRMAVSGMSDAEIAEAERVSGDLSERYKALSTTTIMHALRNMRAIVGTYEEAGKILEPILKLRIATMGAHPERAAELAEDFDKLVKGMEIKGVTMDPEKFTSYMQGMAKAINVFGDTLRPTDFYEMFKYGNTAVQALSQKFMLETAPTFAQEMGGSRTGSSLAMFYAKTVGDTMTLIAANELKKFGLIDMNKVQSKAGRITKLHPGAVAGWQLAAHDPYAWVNDVFLPALKAHGVTDKDQILGEIATIFGSGRQSSGALVSILATQQARIQKDWALVHGAKGLDAADAFMSKDPFIAWQGVTEQFKNFLALAGSPLAEPAAKGLNELASGIDALENALKGHPLAATGLTAAGLAGGGIGAWKLSRYALGKFFGMVRGGAAATPAGEEWTAAAAIQAMRAASKAPLLAPEAAAGGGWLSSLFAGPGAMALPFYLATKDAWPAAQQQISTALARHYGADTPWVKALQPTDAAKPEVKGSADLNVKVSVEPSDDFISRIIAALRNEINVLGGSSVEPGSGVGTAGSTGLSMPQATPGP